MMGFNGNDMQLCAAQYKAAQNTMKDIAAEYFNLPSGWGCCLQGHYKNTRFSVYNNKKKGLPCFLVEFVNGQASVVETDQGLSSVDWYILSQRFGGNDAPF